MAEGDGFSKVFHYSCPFFLIESNLNRNKSVTNETTYNFVKPLMLQFNLHVNQILYLSASL